MIDPVGPAKRKYRDRLKKIIDEEICRLTSTQLTMIKKGEVVPYNIPVKDIPHFVYGPWPGEGESEGGGNDPAGPVYGEFNEESLKKFLLKDLELEVLKPGRRLTKEKIIYPGISKRGDESLLNLDETIFAMIERQVAMKKFKKGNLDIEVDEDDFRYNFPQIKYKEDKDAVVVFISDVSGSIYDEEAKAAEAISYLIKLWLELAYPFVERVYIAHNATAWEEKEEDYFKLRTDGGTVFSEAYNTLLAMIEGKPYTTNLGKPRTLNSSLVDIYAIHMTDGGNFIHDNGTAIEALEKLLPNLTRFCYLGLKGDAYDSAFERMIQQKFTDTNKCRTYVTDVNNENDWIKAMKAFFGKVK